MTLRPAVMARGPRACGRVRKQQPVQQVDDQLRDVEPVGLRASPVAFDRDPLRIHDVTFNAMDLQGPANPECILAGFVAHDDPRIVRK